MKRFFTLTNLRLAFEVLLVIAIAAAALDHFIPTRAAAPEPGAQNLAEQAPTAPDRIALDPSVPEAPEALYWYQCNSPAVEHVAVFTNRVHVWCQTTTPVSGAPALTGIYWFAYPTSDSANASRFMSLLQTSTVAGRYVWIMTNPTDTSGSAFGCGSSNCRRIYGLELR